MKSLAAVLEDKDNLKLTDMLLN